MQLSSARPDLQPVKLLPVVLLAVLLLAELPFELLAVASELPFVSFAPQKRLSAGPSVAHAAFFASPTASFGAASPSLAAFFASPVRATFFAVPWQRRLRLDLEYCRSQPSDQPRDW